MLKPKRRLFCFPYAGGSPTVFFSWVDKLPDDTELILAQFPGRGARFSEMPHNQMGSLIADLLMEAQLFTEMPFALFGHSLGGLVAYELTYQLKLAGYQLPDFIVASACRAPHLPRGGKSIYDLPHPEFIEELRNLNGTPKEILEDKELMKILNSQLRADLEIAENYLGKATKLPCPILVMNGDGDTNLGSDQLNAWQDLTQFTCSRVQINGDHFFINQRRDEIIMEIFQHWNKFLKDFNLLKFSHANL